MPGTGAQVRGLSLIHWLASFEQLYGSESRRSLAAALPHEIATAVTAELSPHGWYPVAWFRALCAAGCDVTGEGLEMIGKVAQAAARAEFSGVHRILVLFVSPRRLLQMSARLFSRYYSEGQVVARPIGPTASIVEWTGCREFDRNLWHDCWHATAVVVEMCGARDVRWECTEGGDDAEHATVAYRWR